MVHMRQRIVAKRVVTSSLSGLGRNTGQQKSPGSRAAGHRCLAFVLRGCKRRKSPRPSIVCFKG
jgi:hypothetical protein